MPPPRPDGYTWNRLLERIEQDTAVLSDVLDQLQAREVGTTTRIALVARAGPKLTSILIRATELARIATQRVRQLEKRITDLEAEVDRLQLRKDQR